jgi:hypothetical protein
MMHGNQAKKAREISGVSGHGNNNDNNGNRLGLIGNLNNNVGVGGGGGGGGVVVSDVTRDRSLGSSKVIVNIQPPSPLPWTNTVIGKAETKNINSSGDHGADTGIGRGQASVPALTSPPTSQTILNDGLVVTDFHDHDLSNASDDGLTNNPTPPTANTPPPRANTPPKVTISPRIATTQNVLTTPKSAGTKGDFGEENMIRGVHQRLVSERSKSRKGNSPGQGQGQGLAPGEGEGSGYSKTLAEDPVFLSTQQPSSSTLPTTLAGTLSTSKLP